MPNEFYAGFVAKHFIETLKPVADAVDRLEWTVHVSTGFFGTRPDGYVMEDWEGDVALYREPVNGIPGPGFKERRRLPARWTAREETFRVHAPEQKVFTFATELPGAALDRIEAFRSGGRLFARLEGRFKFMRVGPYDWDDPTFLAEWTKQTRGQGVVNWAKVNTMMFELHPNIWVGDVLEVLRDRSVLRLEVLRPKVPEKNEIVERAVGNIGDAEAAFHRGEYGDVARHIYRALDETEKLLDAVAASRGEFFKARLKEQAKAVRSICDPERHGERPSGPTGTVDRVVAQHLLAVAQTLLAVFASS